MARAIEETNRRREKQIAHNTEHGITPTTIKREVADILADLGERPGSKSKRRGRGDRRRVAEDKAAFIGAGESGHNLKAVIADLEKQMREAAADLEFEEAARLRDEVKRLREQELGL